MNAQISGKEEEEERSNNKDYTEFEPLLGPGRGSDPDSALA
jgi:hypothetical protein